MRERQAAVRSSRRWRPSRRAASRCAPSDASGATRRRSARSCRLLAGEQAGEQARERACVAAVDRSRSGGHAGRHRTRGRCRRPPPPRRRAREPQRSSTRCPPSGRSPRSTVSPSATAPSSTARCEIDLSPGTATPPWTDTAGSIFIRRGRARPRRRSPAPRAAPPRAPPRRHR